MASGVYIFLNLIQFLLGKAFFSMNSIIHKILKTDKDE